MINIFVSIELNKIKFFNEYNDLFKKYNINFHSSLKDCHIVLFFYNLGKPAIIRQEILNHFYINKNIKYDCLNEEKCIEYLIEKLNKKVIIYFRSDGSSIRCSINELIKKYKEILFVIRDFMLKEEKKYLTNDNNYFKYLIHKHFENKDNQRNIKEIFNLLNKYFCYTFPKFDCVGYGFSKFNNEIKNHNKIYDIFFVKNYRENTLNCLLRKKTLEFLLNFNKKHNNKFNICWKPCTKEEYHLRLTQSKICISTWGIGESLRDDYFCVLNNIICLKIDTSFTKDFYGLFKKDKLFYTYNIDFSNFESKLLELLERYHHYQKINKKNVKNFFNKYTLDYHVEILSNKINQEFNNYSIHK